MYTYKNTPYKITDFCAISCDDIQSRWILSDLFIHERGIEFTSEEEITKRRKRDVDMCVRLDNYFATLAAMLEWAQKNEKVVTDKVLDGAKKDLLYLQREYCIKQRKYCDE